MLCIRFHGTNRGPVKFRCIMYVIHLWLGHYSLVMFDGNYKTKDLIAIIARATWLYETSW